jgi:hypothetical protein
MRIKLPLILFIAFASPALLAQTAVTGSLADFGRDTAGGQTAASWGLPQPSGAQSGAGETGGQTSGGQSGPGQSSAQAPGGQSGPGQSSAQSPGGQSGPGQSSAQSPGGQSGPGQSSSQSSNQNSNQNSSQSSNQNSNQNSSQSGDGPSQPSSGQSGAAGEQDGSKGEPNLPDGDGNGDGGNGSGQDPKGEPNYPSDGGNGSGNGNGDGGRDGNSNNGDGGDGNDGEYKPLDDGDPQYDPNGNEGETEIPSGCAEANSTCAQCVRQAEENIQFNRSYLHIAWSISHSTLDYANKRIAFGDTVSGIHGAMALSWQLAGKPQIEEAMESLRKTYGKKYKDYIKNIEASLHKMADCEAENYSIRDLYQRFGFLYLEFIKSRYESPD